MKNMNDWEEHEKSCLDVLSSSILEKINLIKKRNLEVFFN